MKTVVLSILLAAGATLAGAAHAQEAPAAPAGPPASSYAPVGTSDLGQVQPQWDGDSWRIVEPARMTGNPIRIGVAALKANEFMLAEEMFADYLERKPNNADANFYMGVAKMNLGQWQDARKYLEFAATNKPEHPDPKSRLGVTYAKLGDTAGANAQRADLVRMSDACKNACRLSPYITGGIQMIDKALAENPAGQG